MSVIRFGQVCLLPVHRGSPTSVLYGLFRYMYMQFCCTIGSTTANSEKSFHWITKGSPTIYPAIIFSDTFTLRLIGCLVISLIQDCSRLKKWMINFTTKSVHNLTETACVEFLWNRWTFSYLVTVAPYLVTMVVEITRTKRLLQLS